MKTRTAIAIFALLVLFALIQAGFRASARSRAFATAEISARGRSLSVLLADTELKRMRGLSGRQSLAANEGMLFVFPKEDFHGIWMKDMLFSIDIIWLGGEWTSPACVNGASRTCGKLLVAVDMKKDVLPDTFPAVFYPKEKAAYVLEAPSGFIQANNIAIWNVFRLR